MTLTAEDILRHDRKVPRYTSYPTAADFTDAVGAKEYGRWLKAIPAGEDISLYIHVPFCKSLCWFCGCHTTVARRHEPVARYVELLLGEIKLLMAALAPKAGEARKRLVHIHWGGGTPTMLAAGEITRILDHLRTGMDFSPDLEFAVEIDPRSVDDNHIAMLARAGMTRASLGVQDFDPAVQRAINRIQPFDMTERVVKALRVNGIDALNIDLIYGLPEQTEAGLMATVDRTIDLKPQRIALYGYAHVPWMKRHQYLIKEDRLPGAPARKALFDAAMSRFTDNGYVAIGLDHLALPSDPLAAAARNGSLKRNFQGYTTEPATVLLGLGASAIGSLGEGYAQNASRATDYGAAIEAGRFATSRGVALTEEDRLSRRIIERLMCDMEVDLDEITAGGSQSRGDSRELSALEACGAIQRTGARITVVPEARLLLRVVCAAFDARLQGADQTAPRHAQAV